MLQSSVLRWMVEFIYCNRRITKAPRRRSRKQFFRAGALLVLALTMTTALRPLRSNVMKRRLVWHRNRDLRFHDHPFYDDEKAIPDATAATRTTSVFVFDDAFGCGIQSSTCLPQQWTATHLGPHGMRVLLESVQDLRRNSLLYSSQELVVRRGPTIPTLLGLLEELIQADIENDCKDASGHDPILYEVCWNEEPGFYERKVSENFQNALAQRFEALASAYNEATNRTIRLSIQTAMSCTLYHPNDLPAPGEWQPLSKKEKRRRQKQQQRENSTKHGVENKANASTAIAILAVENKDAFENPNHTIDVSLDRWIGMPRIMGDFRRIAREKAGVRDCRKAPRQGEKLAQTKTSTIDPGAMPSLEELLQPLLTYIEDESSENKATKLPILGLPNVVIRRVCENSISIHRANLQRMETDGGDEKELSRVGGETAGLKHLEHFVTNHAHTAQRSLACVDNYQSSRLSHYLAFGCLSPRKVVHAAEAAIAARKNSEPIPHETDGTWLISHMTMRDFFLYTCLASGKQFYQLEGIPLSQKVAASMQWTSFGDKDAIDFWKSWALGSTGLPLVDASMTELLETGYCSNRVRQNAASVLTKDLQLDWRAGAEWFQFLLEDHCVGANWGNWLYFSGVGPDPKNRHFCTISQAYKYDPEGEYVKKWIPSLGDPPEHEANGEYFLRPWDFDKSWKRPIVDPETQYTWRDLERLKKTGRLMEAPLVGN